MWQQKWDMSMYKIIISNMISNKSGLDKSFIRLFLSIFEPAICRLLNNISTGNRLFVYIYIFWEKVKQIWEGLCWVPTYANSGYFTLILLYLSKKPLKLLKWTQNWKNTFTWCEKRDFWEKSSYENISCYIKKNFWNSVTKLRARCT